MKNMKNKNQTLVIIIYSLLLLFGIGYFLYSLFFLKNNQLFNIINSFLIVFLTAMLFLNQITKKSVYKFISFVMIFSIIACNILNNFDVFAKKIITLGNLTNRSINDVLNWTNNYNINVKQIYEYSDNINEFNIISQDIDSNTSIENIDNLKLIVSLGPNYDKIVVIPNLVGSNIDELLKIKNELFLNNVIIEYKKSNEEKDTIIDQSLKGQYSRNTQITFTISLGNEDLTEINMINLTNKNIFDATLWLKQNNIKYELNYEFSEINKNTVLSQNIKENTLININNDKIILTVSKGKSIKVPNLINMSSKEVIDWISDNNLNIEFNEAYDTSVPLGNIISANYKDGDVIESGTLIKITTSKGQIKFPNVTTLQELKNWANNYNIIVNEQYTTSNDIKKGNIISANYKENEVVDPTKPISAVISTGKPITIPNFYNMSKTEISKKCNTLGLVCTFYEKSYSNVKENYALSQSVNAGSTVTSGKTISIGLSKGPAKTFTIKLSQATIQSCIGDSNCTINNLKSYLNANYPGVIFNFSTATSSTFNNAGFIHENSEINDKVTVTQGNTYKVIITK